MKIKTESLPARCEICHQSDCFDAISNTCARCGSLEAIQIRQIDQKKLDQLVARVRKMAAIAKMQRSAKQKHIDLSLQLTGESIAIIVVAAVTSIILAVHQAAGIGLGVFTTGSIIGTLAYFQKLSRKKFICVNDDDKDY
jgi:hypothetical protein